MPYILFAFDSYYPCGGIGDCIGIILADSDKEAILKAKDLKKESDHLDYWELIKIEGNVYTALDFE